MYPTVVLSEGDAHFAKNKLNEVNNGNNQMTVNVTSFDNDELSIDAHVLSPSGGWLVYDDSYTPAWHATVDGHKTSVYRGYLAFKAIWLDSGPHKVRFYYQNNIVLICSYLVAIGGGLTAAGLIFLVL